MRRKAAIGLGAGGLCAVPVGGWLVVTGDQMVGWILLVLAVIAGVTAIAVARPA